MVINRLNGFFSLERWINNRWQLPLVGLLVMTGVAAKVSTLQAAPPQEKQAADATEIASTLPTVTPMQKEPTVNSPLVTSTLAVVAPQPQEPTLDSTVAPSTWQAPAPQEQEPTVDSTLVAPASKPTTPQKVATSQKVAVPQRQEKAIDANAVAMPSSKWNRSVKAAHKGTIAQVPASATPMPDGIYLYGKTSQPGQIGKEYLVFEANKGKVIGALYMPSSEYSCFSGTLDSKQLNLTVANSYDQTAVSHTIARAQPARIAAVGGSINLDNTYDSLTYPHTVQLDGYQLISQISDNDKQILNSCRSNPQAGGNE